MKTIAVVCTLIFGSSLQAQGQLPKLMDEQAEIAMALEAALPNVSGGATVYVLKRGGHVVARRGSNGFACLVSRDHIESLYPICYNPEGAETVLPGALMSQRLREEGKSNDEIEQIVATAYRDGKLKAPTKGAIAYMMSPRQVIYAGATGPRVGQYRPHLMLYMPYATRQSVGLDKSLDSQVFLALEGKATAHLIVPLKDWSTPPSASAPER